MTSAVALRRRQSLAVVPCRGPATPEIHAGHGHAADLVPRNSRACARTRAGRKAVPFTPAHHLTTPLARHGVMAVFRRVRTHELAPAQAKAAPFHLFCMHTTLPMHHPDLAAVIPPPCSPASPCRCSASLERAVATLRRTHAPRRPKALPFYPAACAQSRRRTSSSPRHSCTEHRPCRDVARAHVQPREPFIERPEGMDHAYTHDLVDRTHGHADL